jgi:hypothetical protein
MRGSAGGGGEERDEQREAEGGRHERQGREEPGNLSPFSHFCSCSLSAGWGQPDGRKIKRKKKERELAGEVVEGGGEPKGFSGA